MRIHDPNRAREDTNIEHHCDFLADAQMGCRGDVSQKAENHHELHRRPDHSDQPIPKQVFRLGFGVGVFFV